MLHSRLARGAACVVGWVALAGSALAAPVEPVLSLAGKEKPAVVETIRQLVTIESGSRDKEGLDQVAATVAQRLTALGGKVETIEPTEIMRMEDTPKEVGKVVVARFEGKGKRRIMLLSHMDTVFPRGTLEKKPFRIEGNKAYGPGVADNKGGVAVVLHTLSILKAMSFRDYGLITVVVNGDEEISSPGGRSVISRLGAEHDVVLSCEPTKSPNDVLTTATSGIGAATLVVRGKASHAGSAPEKGRNALVELSHQIMQSRDLSDPARGVKFNWTIGNVGKNPRNVIPDFAKAEADVRVQKVADYDGIERAFRERVTKKLIEETQVEPSFERRRPPLEPSDGARKVVAKAQAIYGELGLKLGHDDAGTGGGTDAAFAAASGKPAVVERFGLAGSDTHSEGEFVDLDSIQPRLYLLTRLVMEMSR
jgi:glutamate carboxypeptidase